MLCVSHFTATLTRCHSFPGAAGYNKKFGKIATFGTSQGFKFGKAGAYGAAGGAAGGFGKKGAFAKGAAAAGFKKGAKGGKKGEAARLKAVALTTPALMAQASRRELQEQREPRQEPREQPATAPRQPRQARPLASSAAARASEELVAEPEPEAVHAHVCSFADEYSHSPFLPFPAIFPSHEVTINAARHDRLSVRSAHRLLQRTRLSGA